MSAEKTHIVVVDLAVPTESFELGEIIGPPPGVEVEFVEFVPAGTGTGPYLWVADGQGGIERFERRVQADDRVEDVWRFHAQGGRYLVRVDWERPPDGFLDACLADEVMIVHGRGVADEWTFKLRFLDHDALRTFRRQCQEAKIQLRIHRVSNPEAGDDSGSFGLTDPQREVVVLAHERGYFHDPHRVTLTELGEELGITRQAVSYRLRDGLNQLIDATLRS